MKIQVSQEVDLSEYGLVQMAHWQEAKKLLNDVYGVLWCQAYYDRDNEEIQTFCRPLADKLSQANKLLEFKK